MTQPDMKRLRELLAKATPGPWSYRPQEFDDWGFIRTTIELGAWHPVVAVSRGDAEHGLHRARGTDPYEPNGRLITEAVNALPNLIDTIETLTAERDWLREALKPFARHQGKNNSIVVLKVGEDTWTGTLSTDHFAAARAALNGEPS